MKRHLSAPRPDWSAKVEAQGFTFHTIDGEPYWDESAYYTFQDEEIALIQQATSEIHQMGLEVVCHIVDKGLYDRFDIPDWFAALIEKSWKQKEPDLYGRIDLVYSGSKAPPKLLEYNADTACSLLESGPIQQQWKEDLFPEKRQFNDIHQNLLRYWNSLKFDHTAIPIHFCCYWDFTELRENLVYLSKTAEEAGIPTELLSVTDLRWDESSRKYINANGKGIHALVKLRSWGRFLNDFIELPRQASSLQIFEPAWKYLLSNKAILPLFWRLFPKHPNLLPAYYIPEAFEGSYVKKATVSGAGANIQIFTDARRVLEQSPDYAYRDQTRCIYQQFHPLPEFDGNYTVMGSWLIGGEPSGISLLEDKSLITQQTCRFVPHIIV